MVFGGLGGHARRPVQRRVFGICMRGRCCFFVFLGVGGQGLGPVEFEISLWGWFVIWVFGVQGCGSGRPMLTDQCSTECSSSE